MIKRILALSAALVLTPAWSINRCTGADGKVVFQDAPCSGKGQRIDVRPSRGAAPSSSASPESASVSPTQAAPARKKEGAFGESWQRRTYLENRGLPDARAAVDHHLRKCAEQQRELASRKSRANNNLAGAT